MKRLIGALVVFTLTFGNQMTQAQEAEKAEKAPSVEEAMAKIAELGPGVHSVIKDKKGRIKSCVVVGQATISTVLGKAKGIEIARDKANLACSTEFVKWLKEEVSVVQSNDDQSVILIEGEEGGDDEYIKSFGKSVEANSKKMTSIAAGLTRGMQVLHKILDGDGKTYTVVKGWKADTAEGVKKVAADLATDAPESKSDKSKKSTGGASKEKATSKKIDKEIESGSATSDDAADFLPKKK